MQLGTAIAAGLPVPAGCALSWSRVETFVADEARLRDFGEQALEALGAPVAVRSSAIGEDSAGASFAGQHETRLGVLTIDDLVHAVHVVHGSAFSPAVLAYRSRMGVPGPPRIGIVVQRLVDAECAGVMFTRNPLNGSDERVIEAGWGLGEAIVAGLITPDHYRLARDGTLLEERTGEKDLAFRLTSGGVREERVAAHLVGVPCLDRTHLGALHDLAARCERAFGSDLDLEWAFEATTVHLLQHRPITTSPGV